jgi:hypothetical protein
MYFVGAALLEVQVHMTYSVVPGQLGVPFGKPRVKSGLSMIGLRDGVARD